MPTSRTDRAGLLVLLFAVGIGAQSAPSPADYKKARLAEVTSLVPKLEQLVAWCTELKLYRERDRLNALIVALDADHERARAALQYRRQKDGSWIRSKDWKEARNQSEKPLAEYAKKRAETVDPVVSRLIAALDRDKTTMDPATRGIWLGELLEIAPDSVQVRGLAGEKKLKDRWVLAETAIAAERRPEAANLAQLLRDGEKKIEDGKANEHEAALPLKWTAIRQTGFVRVVATVPPPQVDTAVRHCDAAWQLTHRLLGVEPAADVQATVGCLRNDVEAKTYLATHPETPDADRGRLLPDYTLTASRCVVVGYDLEAERTRIAVSRLTSIAAARATGAELPPWVIEGMGLHVMQLLTGQREPLFGRVNPAGSLEAELRKVLWKSDTKWLATAAAMAKDGKGAKLDRILSVGLFKMTPLDSLFAAAFIAYLLEGRPGDGLTFIRTSARAIKPGEAVNEALGMPIAELEARFHRWLDETSTLIPR